MNSVAEIVILVWFVYLKWGRVLGYYLGLGM